MENVLHEFGDKSFEFWVVSSEQDACGRRVLLFLGQVSKEPLESDEFSTLVVFAF